MTTNSFIRGEVEQGDIFFVDPFSIEIGDERAVQNKQATDMIVEMAVSLFIHGQRRAVECRKSNDDRWLLQHGLLRTIAGRMICLGFKYKDPPTGAEIAVRDKRFRLKVVITPRSSGSPVSSPTNSA